MKARIWLLVSAVVLVAFVLVAASRSPSSTTGTTEPTTTEPTTTEPSATTTQPTLSPLTTSPLTTSPLTTSPPTTSPLTTSPPTTSPPTTTQPQQAGPWRPRPVFRDRLLVAYYGTAGTGSLGVLGSGPIPRVTAELRHAARGFAHASGQPTQIVYELIATVADDYAGADGSYSHDIDRADVEDYLHAARRNHALLVLDVQPGRSDFLTVVERYAWILQEPDVGIALDPEWRMHGDQVPGEDLGWVSADEVNATARYVASIARAHRLPQKLFLIHQFVPQAVYDQPAITPVKGVAMVQHVDGFGAESEKLATYHNVARPQQFTMGFKLFYRADIGLMSPAEVLAKVPDVRFVSYQ